MGMDPRRSPAAVNHRRLDIARFRNLGPKPTGRLESIAIHTVEDLERIGSVMALKRPSSTALDRASTCSTVWRRHAAKNGESLPRASWTR